MAWNKNDKVKQISFDIKCSDKTSGVDIESLAISISELINNFNDSNGENLECLNGLYDYEDITEQYKNLN